MKRAFAKTFVHQKMIFSEFHMTINKIISNHMRLIFSCLFSMVLCIGFSQESIVYKAASYPGCEVETDVFKMMTCSNNSLNEYFKSNSKLSGKEGTVIVEVQINIDGSVSNPVIVEGTQEDLNNEALRMIGEMKPWNPAEDRSGNKISVKQSFYVNFE